MTSITMAASFLGSSAIGNRSPVATQKRFLVVNAAKAVEGERVVKVSNEKDNGRRNIMFAAAAAAVCSVARMAVADDEPKRGSPEAKKAYAPVCVTNPTARICRR